MVRKNIFKTFTYSAYFRKIINRLDKIQLRKKEVSLYRIMVNLFDNLNKDDIFHKAASVAFSFSLAVFPAIIFLFSLLPYIPIPDLQANIQYLIKDMALFDQVNHTIMDVINKPRGDLLSFSVLLTLFLSTNGMMELVQTFNKIYRTIEKRSYWYSRLVATMLTIIMAIVLFVATLMLTLGSWTLNFLVKEGLLAQDFLYYSLLFLKFLVLYILFQIAISAIYYFGPALHNRWKFISAGSVVATILSLIVTYLFSAYITNFGTYNKLYGSIGAMIAFMVWTYLISIILLIGFEINASIDQAVIQKEEEQAEKS